MLTREEIGRLFCRRMSQRRIGRDCPTRARRNDNLMVWLQLHYPDASKS